MLPQNSWPLYIYRDQAKKLVNILFQVLLHKFNQFPQQNKKQL